MLCNLANTSVDSELILYLAILIGITLAVYKISKIIKYLLNIKKHHKALQKERKIHQESQAKNDAIARFKDIHAQARDHRKKIAKEITSNPQKTAAALRKMMKR